MRLTLLLAAFSALFISLNEAGAQQWLSELPPNAEKDLSFQEIRQAFQRYYEKHPIDAKRDRLRPLSAAEEIAEPRARVAMEEYKLFKRWEWLVEPRLYPTGRLDMKKVDEIRERISLADEQRIRELAKTSNPLGVRLLDSGKIVWPFPRLWSPIGPSDAVNSTNLGRVNSIRFDPSNSNIIYLGSPDGGVWKSTDGGVSWVPKFDSQPTLSVGDVAIDPTNSNVIYVATSDQFGYGTPFWGGTYSIGIRKSADGGNTWAATGLSWTVSQNRTIRRLAIHPSNGNILLAATSDGTYRTSDGGVNWTRVDATSSYDVEFQPDNGNIVYVTTTRVLKSTDAGSTFSGLSATCSGTRFNIEVARSNTSTLYTLCTDGTVQKSTDAGSHWNTVTAPGATLYGYYDNVLAVSPVSADVVYVAGFNIRRSTDGGNTWAALSAANHPDNHCITFLPGSSSTLLVGNDGGIFKTNNSGATWTSLNKTLSITQFYGPGISRTIPAIMVLGAQDNGNMKSNAGVFTSITNADGMKGFIDWSNADVIYASIQNGSFYRSTNGGTTFTSIDTPSSGAWVSPWLEDPNVANTIYAGTDKVYKSTDQGTTWTAISGSLSGIGTFGVVKIAPNNSQFIYAGNGQKLYRTKNGGSTWTDITAGLPVSTNYLTDVAVHDYEPNIVYATFSGYVNGQKVYKSCDGGATWTNISGSLPNMPVNTIVHDKNTNALYVGTDAGVYYINDNLNDWIPYKFGLPNVIVDQLEIHYGTKVIRAATYGRGAWQAPLK